MQPSQFKQRIERPAFFRSLHFGVFSLFRQRREAPAKPGKPLTEQEKYPDARDRNNGCA
jgi:hypothetical protein